LPASPWVLSASGTGQGQVSVSTAELDYGLVNCGASAAAQQVTISNTGSVAFDVTGATLGTGTYYALTIPGGALPVTVAAGGSQIFTVTPATIPVNTSVVDGSSVALPNLAAFADTLTFVTDEPNDVASHAVTLRMGARGVILNNSFTTTTWNFGNVNVGQPQYINFEDIVNLGNAPVKVTFAQSAGVTNYFGISSTPVAGVRSLVLTQTALPGTSTSLIGNYDFRGIFTPGDVGLVNEAATLYVEPAPGFTECKTSTGWGTSGSPKNITLSGNGQ
jgi:hypothetical protein